MVGDLGTVMRLRSILQHAYCTLGACRQDSCIDNTFIRSPVSISKQHLVASIERPNFVSTPVRNVDEDFVLADVIKRQSAFSAIHTVR